MQAGIGNNTMNYIRAKRNEITLPCIFKKSEGLITIKPMKEIAFESQDKKKSILLKYDEIMNVEKAENTVKSTSLLKIVTKTMSIKDGGHIFSFFGDDRVEKRDRVYDIILKKESEAEDFFRLSSFYHKKKILKIFNDDYLSYLFDELVMRRQILNREEFFSFTKRKYSYKYDFTSTIQAITFTRNEELSFLSYFYFNTFNFQTKKKLLAINENMGILLEKHLKDLKSEEKFWREFIKNQRENESELVGGLRPLYFTNPELNFAESEKARIQKENTKLSEQSKNPNYFNSLKKLGKKFENFEKNFHYAHKNHGINLNVNELDFKDQEIKRLNFDEPADRKEITNFIENLNDYSSRKLSANSYVNKRFIDVKGKRFLSLNSGNVATVTGPTVNPVQNQSLGANAGQQALKQVQGQVKIESAEDKEMQREVSNFADGISKNLENKNNNHQNAIHYNYHNNKNIKHLQNENLTNTFNNDKELQQHHHPHHKRSHFFSNKLNEMKHNYLVEKAHHNKDVSNNTQESLDIFNKLNEATAKAPKLSNPDKIRIEDYNIITEIFNKHEIIKDIFLINNYIKYSNYSDQIKKQKRNLVKNFTNEIETYRINMKNNRNLSNPVKANLELLNSFLNKIKPNTATSG